MIPLARHENGQLFGKRGAGDRTHEEGGEIVPRVLRKGKGSASREVVLARRQRRGLVAIGRPDHFVAHLQTVLACDARQVILKDFVLTHLARITHCGDAVSNVEVRECLGRDSRYGQGILRRFRTIRIRGRAPIVANPELIESYARKDGREADDPVDVVGGIDLP